MTIHTSTAPTAARPASRSGTPRLRARAVGLSSSAAAATWIVADLVLAVDVSTPSLDSIGPADDLGLGLVIVVATITTLLGWALLAVLERATGHAQAIWTSAAIAVTVVSLAGPLSGAGVTISQRIVLVALHLIVAAVFVPSMYRTIHPSPGTRS